jgi:hypothetical protein
MSREHISVPDGSCARHIITFALREFGPQNQQFGFAGIGQTPSENLARDR